MLWYCYKLFTTWCTEGVDVMHGVERLAFLGVRSAQKMYMTQWHGRLILAVIEASSVFLYAVDPGTHEVGTLYWLSKQDTGPTDCHKQ